eukprot:gene266-580_t
MCKPLNTSSQPTGCVSDIWQPASGRLSRFGGHCQELPKTSRQAAQIFGAMPGAARFPKEACSLATNGDPGTKRRPRVFATSAKMSPKWRRHRAGTKAFVKDCHGVGPGIELGPGRSASLADMSAKLHRHEAGTKVSPDGGGGIFQLGRFIEWQSRPVH